MSHGPPPSDTFAASSSGTPPETHHVDPPESHQQGQQQQPMPPMLPGWPPMAGSLPPALQALSQQFQLEQIQLQQSQLQQLQQQLALHTQQLQQQQQHNQFPLHQLPGQAGQGQIQEEGDRKHHRVWEEDNGAQTPDATGTPRGQQGLPPLPWTGDGAAALNQRGGSDNESSPSAHATEPASLHPSYMADPQGRLPSINDLIALGRLPFDASIARLPAAVLPNSDPRERVSPDEFAALQREALTYNEARRAQREREQMQAQQSGSQINPISPSLPNSGLTIPQGTNSPQVLHGSSMIYEWGATRSSVMKDSLARTNAHQRMSAINTVASGAATGVSSGYRREGSLEWDGRERDREVRGVGHRSFEGTRGYDEDNYLDRRRHYSPGERQRVLERQERGGRGREYSTDQESVWDGDERDIDVGRSTRRYREDADVIGGGRERERSPRVLDRWDRGRTDDGMGESMEHELPLMASTDFLLLGAGDATSINVRDTVVAEGSVKGHRYSNIEEFDIRRVSLPRDHLQLFMTSALRVLVLINVTVSRAWGAPEMGKSLRSLMRLVLGWMTFSDQRVSAKWVCSLLP
ncbi:hypothetical protein HDV00_006942 [Rhizophlyctis rosea]|nr:hypothetical protein HDV00_006942 [Rhizophlyctis rosea]